MFRKAYCFNDSVVFYFDKQDNKYVAKGGSEAWRLNNPGLIASHSPFAKKFGSIGGNQHYAIFPTVAAGINAHQSWLRSKKYYSASLLEIAKHYAPEKAEGYLRQLCKLTGISSNAQPKNLSKDHLQKLLEAIQVLNGFSKTNAWQFDLLPKITARFHSRDESIVQYLVGQTILLELTEAIEWVKTHRLDAVIVHQKSGKIYLRSRPGHHFNQIKFSEEEYGEPKNFKEAIRDVGVAKKGQPIWGFVNGISTNAERALDCATYISNHSGGQQVWSFVNDAYFGNGWTLKDAFYQKLNKETVSVKLCIQFLKFLIDLSKERGEQRPIVIFAHSQGALIVDLALNKLTTEERKRIQAYTFGGLALISSEKSNAQNFFSSKDPIPFFASKDRVQFLLRFHLRQKLGLTAQEIIEECVKEDFVSYYQQDVSLESVEEFRQRREQHYKNELKQSENITILDDTISEFWEHSFDLPSYQAKIRELVEYHKQ